MLMYWL